MTPIEAAFAIAGTVLGAAFTAAVTAVSVTWRLGRELERLKTKIEALEKVVEQHQSEAREERQEGNRLWHSTMQTSGRILGILEGRRSTPGE